MASQVGNKLPKLFAVTLIRSRTGRPWWTKRTLDALGLKKLRLTIIHKSTPSVNGLLNQVKDMVDIKPIDFRTDVENSPSKGEILLDNGQFFVTEKTLQELSQEVEQRFEEINNYIYINKDE